VIGRLIGAVAIASTIAALAAAGIPATASPGDVYVTALHCGAPGETVEFVRIKNFGSASQSLSNFYLQSDPSQNYPLSNLVGSIGAGQTLEFQSGSGSASNPGAGIYKLTGSFIYRNGDPTDYARLVRSDASHHQVNCGSTPSTPAPTTPPTATPAPTQPPVVYFGDVDCGGSINSVDALKVLRHSSSLSVTLPPWCSSFAADVDCSGSINSVDALKLLRYNASLSVIQNEPCPDVGTVPGEEGQLAIHHIDVEQGDAALIISPGGDAAMIDMGLFTTCANTVSYVQAQGVTSLKYAFATHYHADHIGCLDDLAAAGIAVETACYDRGSAPGSITQTYTDYVNTCGAKRQTAVEGQVVSLADGATITVVDLNGAGDTTSDENALGAVFKLTYGAFDHVFAGDIPGVSPDDIEGIVGPEVGDVEVCKVNHHGSASSSTDAWLNAITPEVCVLSVGANGFGHPTAEAMGRMHAHGIETYWTNAGSGVAPDPTYDRVLGDVIVTVVGSSYSVDGNVYTAE
jgi:competence protein ComEC